MSASTATPSDLEQAEVSLNSRIAQTREHPAVQTAGRLAKLGDQEPLYALAVGLVAVGLVARRPLLVHAGLRAGAAVAASDVAKRLIKRVYKRSRPRTVIDGDGYRSGAGGAHDKADQSFPSGHVAATLAFARAIDRVYPAGRPVGWMVVAALGATRVAQGEHWPSDVAAGAVIGLAAERLTRVGLDRVLARLELPA